MNNKTASNLSATVNSADSTAASSTITTSDPDSSVSTLSPATTPSMDYGQLDSMEYPPMYYPGYYDENGLLVIRKLTAMHLTSLFNAFFHNLQQCITDTIIIRQTDQMQRRPCISCLIILINTIHSSWRQVACSRSMARRMSRIKRNRMVQKKTIIKRRIKMWV